MDILAIESFLKMGCRGKMPCKKARKEENSDSEEPPSA
jgi:hypothetical protein